MLLYSEFKRRYVKEKGQNPAFEGGKREWFRKNAGAAQGSVGAGVRVNLRGGEGGVAADPNAWKENLRIKAEKKLASKRAAEKEPLLKAIRKRRENISAERATELSAGRRSKNKAALAKMEESHAKAKALLKQQEPKKLTRQEKVKNTVQKTQDGTTNPEGAKNWRQKVVAGNKRSPSTKKAVGGAKKAAGIGKKILNVVGSPVGITAGVGALGLGAAYGLKKLRDRNKRKRR